MDVIPMVGKEVATRFHKCVNSGADVVGGDKSAAAIAAVTADLAAMLVRLRLLGSEKTDEAGNVGDTAEHMEALVESVLRYLYACSMPNLATVLLQSQSYALKASLRGRRRTEDVKAEAIGVRLVQAIVEKQAATATADEILGDITLYILHRYGQLHSADGDAGLPAHKETATVLCSVLPRPQALHFVKQDAMEKQRQLEELRRVVWGIRLFNRDEGKMAGAGLVELHELVERPLVAMEEMLGRELARVETKAQRCLAVLQSPSCPLSAAEQTVLRDEYHHLLQLIANLLTVRCLHYALSNRIHAVIIPNYNSALHELRGIFSNASGAEKQRTTAASSPSPPPTTGGGDLEGDDRARVRPEAVKKRIAYPVFMQLADTYSLAVRTVEELKDADSLLQLTLPSERSYPSSIPDKVADDAVAHRGGGAPPVLMDAAAMEADVARIVAAAEAATASTEAAAALSAPALPEKDANGDASACASTTAGSVGLRLYYAPELPRAVMDAVVAECYPSSFCALRGFCPVTFVETGLLVAGRVSGRAQDRSCPGFLVLEGGLGRRWALPKPLYVAFVDEHALRTFAAAPLRYLTPCLFRSSPTEPATTLLMGLLDRLPRELYIAGSRSVERVTALGGTDASLSVDGAGVGRAEAGAQTGQIDARLDHNYRWNEWDLRRQALKLATLMDMRTHSTQTGASHFKRDGTTQAAPPKEEGTQTMQDAATQPPRVVQYLKGLRGTESSEVEQVQRTILY